MKFFVMDFTGHSTIEFDKEKTADLDALVVKFNELKSLGNTAATRKAGEKDYTLIRDPKDVQDETLFVPQMRGG
jgi:hypothetical protein